ncbi:MAG TPA: hypothetical protein VGL82_01120 [Bryobacteraceae bacterium]|jgi:hypothetical protein
MAQPIRTPDIEAQRAAMKKLDFLIGQWTGGARVLRGPGQWVEMIQTEEARYKLDGLVLLIEGVGRARSDDKPVLQALGMVSFDDETETYRMRAFNDGRFLETEVTLVADNAISWGFALGEIKTSSVLHIDDKGDWTELGELTMGPQPPVKFLELSVRRSE